MKGELVIRLQEKFEIAKVFTCRWQFFLEFLKICDIKFCFSLGHKTSGGLRKHFLAKGPGFSVIKGTFRRGREKDDEPRRGRPSTSIRSGKSSV